MNVSVVADLRGPLRIWKPPRAGEIYVVGVDVAEGIEGGDYSACWVVDGITKEHHATWHGLMDAHFFADQVAMLGYYYNTGMVAVEKNNHGNTVISRLQHDLGYPELYFQRRKATSRKETFSREVTGFAQGRESKRRIMDMLRAVVQLELPIYDDRFYIEGLTWTRDENGMAKTAPGAHDDVLMAAGIAYMVASEHYGQLRYSKPAIRTSPEDTRKKRAVGNWRKIFNSYDHTLAPDAAPVSDAPPELI